MPVSNINSTGCFDRRIGRRSIPNANAQREEYCEDVERLDESDISEFKKIKVCRRFGSAFDAKGWRYFAAAVKGKGQNVGRGGVEFIMTGAVCKREW